MLVRSTSFAAVIFKAKGGSMIYRPLGSTGLNVSQLGFGAMRLPTRRLNGNEVVDRDLAIPMIHRAFAAGVNYIDTAVGYCNEDSQRAVGEAIKGWRNKVIVSTKNPYYGADEAVWWKNLENSLQRLGVDVIDVYSFHGITRQKLQEHIQPLMHKWAIKARDRGLVRHIGCSFHDDNDTLRLAVDSGLFESITLQYNLLDRRLADGIAHAHRKRLGVVVMGPIAGGRLGMSSDVLTQAVPHIQRAPELALRFVLTNPYVSLALSGMSALQQVEDNLTVAAENRALSPHEISLIEEHFNRLKSMADLYCTACLYCLPCPHNVRIPQVFEIHNRGRVYGLWANARGRYKELLATPDWSGPHKCIGCGICETKCPQKISIRKQLQEAHRALSEQ